MHPIASTLVLSLLAASVWAQKATTALDWQSQALQIHYEALPVGEHSLAKLEVGKRWRLGASHDPSTLVAMNPILVGDAWIAPGRYRVQLYRDTETVCTLVPEGAEHAVGKTELLRMPGTIAALPKPASHLAIELSKKGKETSGNQEAEVEIRFGNDGWRGGCLVVGGKTTTLAGARLVTFQVATTHLARGPVPIATLHKDGENPASWNVLLDQDRVVLMPWLPLPKTNFAKIEAPEPSAAIAGKVTRRELADAKPADPKQADVLELREATLAKGELRLVVAYGKTQLECTFPEPQAPAPEPKTPAAEAKSTGASK